MGLRYEFYKALGFLIEARAHDTLADLVLQARALRVGVTSACEMPGALVGRLNSTGFIEWLNDAACWYVGRPRDELIGAHVSGVLLAANYPLLMRGLQMVTTSQRAVVARVVARSGHPFLVALTPAEVGDSIIFCAVPAEEEERLFAMVHDRTVIQ